MLLFKGSSLFTAALFFCFSFFPLVAIATPPPLNLPSANWLVHRQGMHISVAAGGHREMSKRICFGDCREIKVDGLTGESAGSKPSNSPVPLSVPYAASSTEGLVDLSSSIPGAISTFTPSLASASATPAPSIALEEQETTSTSAATAKRIASLPLILTAAAGIAVLLVM